MLSSKGFAVVLAYSVMFVGEANAVDCETKVSQGEKIDNGASFLDSELRRVTVRPEVHFYTVGTILL